MSANDHTMSFNWSPTQIKCTSTPKKKKMQQKKRTFVLPKTSTLKDIKAAIVRRSCEQCCSSSARLSAPIPIHCSSFNSDQNINEQKPLKVRRHDYKRQKRLV